MNEEYDRGYQEGYTAGYRRARIDYGLEDDPPRYGKWRVDFDSNRELFEQKRYYCSACGAWQTYAETDFCPRCGANMKEKEVGNESK